MTGRVRRYMDLCTRRARHQIRTSDRWRRRKVMVGPDLDRGPAKAGSEVEAVPRTLHHSRFSAMLTVPEPVNREAWMRRKFTQDRRQFLRGATYGLALPLLPDDQTAGVRNGPFLIVRWRQTHRAADRESRTPARLWFSGSNRRCRFERSLHNEIGTALSSEVFRRPESAEHRDWTLASVRKSRPTDGP